MTTYVIISERTGCYWNREIKDWTRNLAEATKYPAKPVTMRHERAIEIAEAPGSNR